MPAGQITEEEYERARAGILARSAAMLAKDEPDDATRDRPRRRQTDANAEPNASDSDSDDDLGDNQDSDNGEGPEARHDRQ
jgi:hypothetical protein